LFPSVFQKTNKNVYSITKCGTMRGRWQKFRLSISGAAVAEQLLSCIFETSFL
jgi:hypothetical protein